MQCCHLHATCNLQHTAHHLVCCTWISAAPHRWSHLDPWSPAAGSPSCASPHACAVWAGGCCVRALPSGSALSASRATLPLLLRDKKPPMITPNHVGLNCVLHAHWIMQGTHGIWYIDKLLLSRHATDQDSIRNCHWSLLQVWHGGPCLFIVESTADFSSATLSRSCTAACMVEVCHAHPRAMGDDVLIEAFTPQHLVRVSPCTIIMLLNKTKHTRKGEDPEDGH